MPLGLGVVHEDGLARADGGALGLQHHHVDELAINQAPDGGIDRRGWKQDGRPRDIGTA